MRITLITVLTLVLVGLSFLAGRFTAPPPVYHLSAAKSDDNLAQAFEDFIRAQQETIALYRSSPFFDNDQARAEAYRGFLYDLVGSIKAGALQSKSHPRFMRAVDWTSKSGLDNPDNNYYVAQINDDAEYRILGNRGSTAGLVFQLVVGQPGVRGAGSSTNISVLSSEDMRIDRGGDFEIIVSRDDPGPLTNWLPNGEGAETLLVRYTHNDWSSEQDSPLYIERIGSEGVHADVLTPAAMSAKLRDVAVSLFDRTATWQRFAERAWTMMPRNSISAVRPSQGGLVGQYSAFGTWELDEDQALILSTARSPAAYQGLELGNLWFVSLEYESRTSSLNLEQMHCGEDDRCYAVISHRDPSVQNWLDTEGHRRGIIMMRWQGLSGELSETLMPRAQLVAFASVREYLPGDVPPYSSQQRSEQIRARRHSVQHRFEG